MAELFLTLCFCSQTSWKARRRLEPPLDKSYFNQRVDKGLRRNSLARSKLCGEALLRAFRFVRRNRLARQAEFLDIDGNRGKSVPQFFLTIRIEIVNRLA